jgi:hypothetical protein
MRASERERGLPPRIAARRDKLLGAWAAAHMGLTGEDAASYAMSIVEAGAGGGNDKAIVKKVCGDLVARGFPIVEQDIGRLFQEFAAKARVECLDDS